MAGRCIRMSKQVVLNSAPRVGSTWLIAILEKLLGTKYRPLITTFAKEIMKEQHPLMKMHNGNPLEINGLGLKQIILIRNIYDTIVSRIHFERRMWTLYDDDDIPEHQKRSVKFIKDNPDLSPQEFINKFFDDRKEVIKIWVNNAYPFIIFEHPCIFKCSYEEMKTDCFKVIKNICSFLEIEKSDKEILDIVEETSFRNMANKEIGNDNWMDKHRKGIIGDHKNYLNKQHIDFIDMCIKRNGRRK